MRWENPIWLLGLWILPLLAVLLIYAHRQRQAAARRFADQPMIGRLMPTGGALQAWVKGGLFLVGVGLLIVAAARPRFGVYFERVSARGVDLFVLLDVSRSMLAEDVAPNRLERAKSDVRDLLRKLPGDRVGLIAFAGAPAVIVPLTSDQGFFLGALEGVNTDSAPRGGSLIGDAIRKAIESLEVTHDRDQVIVLITDGEDQDSFPQEAAEQAAEREIKIFTVGLGDPREGRRIPVRDAAGSVRYLKHEGQEVWSRMDERLLKEIALKTSATYIPARTRTYDLGQIYEDHLAGLTRGEIQAEKRKRYAERFQWFVMAGLAALLAEMLIARFPRSAPADEPTNDNSARPASRSRRSRRSAAVVGVVLAGLTWLPPADASVGEAARQVRAGVQHFQRGQYAEAAKRFAEADVALPDNPRIAYDRACAAAVGKDPAKAVELFQQAALARDDEVAAESHYNLGCLAAAKAKTLFGAQPEEAKPEVRQEGLQLLGQAVAHYRDCLRVRENHAAARHNLEVLRQWIKHMQQVWAERDRQQRRQEMDLLQMLEMVTAEQAALRQTARGATREDESPRRRQAVTQAGEQQGQLAEEIGPLKEKIRETLQPSAPQSPPAQQSPPAPQSKAAAPKTATPDADKAVAMLHGLADRAHQAMTQAAQQLSDQNLPAAVESQQQALDALEDIFLAVAPFPQFLTSTLRSQQTLVEQSQQIVQAANEKTDAKPDYEDLTRAQTVVRHRSEILPQRAEAELKQLPPPVAGPPPPPTNPQAKPEPSAAKPPDLRPALQKASELGPKIGPLTTQAAEDLKKKQPAAALPNQEQALKLLREIAELLPKQPPQDGQQQEQPKPQKDQQKDQKQDQQQKQQPSASKPQPQSLSQQQAEALMRKVRERDRQHREKQQQLQQFRRGGVAVDKDW